MSVEQVRDRPLDRRRADLQPQAIDNRDALRWRKAARRLDEPAREVSRFEHARLAGRYHLYFMAVRVGTAVQFEGRVVSDHATAAQTGSGQETVDRPFGGVGMLGHGREYATRDAPDVARLKMLGEHRRDHLVVGTTADSRRVLGAIEDRPSAEEGSGYEPGHGGYG